MRLRRLFIAASASFLAGCAIQVTPAPVAPTASSATNASRGAFGPTESRIFDLINAERRHQGLPALVYNPQLDRMAKIQARNMARFQKMAHELPNADLPTLVD